MPLPGSKPGGSGLTRSEAAILAWKKRPRAKPKNGALDPKIAARVKEILASKQKKGPKPKAGKAKPKGTKQEIANQNRAAIAKQSGIDDGVIVRLGAGMNSDLEKGAHDELIKKGLATRGADGKPKLTAAGKKWRSAADKGDAEGAGAALAEGRAGASESAAKEKAKSDKANERATAKAEREKAKGAKLQERAKKQKQQQQAQKQKAQARAKIAAEKAKAKAAKDAAKLAKEKAKAEPAAAPATSDTPPATDTPPAKQRPVKAIDMDELYTADELLAIKAGARHSRTDMQHLQGIHDSAVACGANCGPGDSAEPDEDDMEDAGKAIKGIMDNPQWYASHECGDIMQASSALNTLAMLIQSELAEDDEDDAHVAMLCDACRTLTKFIDSELDELEGAAGDAADAARMGPMKAIDVREDVNPKAGIAEYGKVDFADAKNKKYPIDTADHVRAAWNYIAKDANAAKYAADEVTQIKAKIVSAWKKLIDKAGPPSAGKAWDSWLHAEGSAIKALEGDAIRGYAVLFGDADNADLQRDYYTKATDFWLNEFGWPKPITYHHGMDAATRDNPIIGHWMKAGVDDVGVWMEGQIDRAHAYYKAMKELVARGYLRLSSDSAPQWVIRERQSNGANYVKRWPIITSSVTVTPMEPRMLPVEVKAFLADIGYEGIDTDAEAINPEDARHDGAKATDDERARVILMELDLLELETA